MASRSSVPFYLSVPSLRVRSISSYRFVGGWCVPFLSARFSHSLRSSSLVSVRHPLAAGACRFPLLATFVRSSRFSSRLARLVWASRFYSLRFVRRLVLLINSLGVSLSRLVWRSGSLSCLSFLGVSLCPVHRFPSRPLVSSSSPYSLVSSGRLVWAARWAGRVIRFPSRSFSVLVSSRSLCLMSMMAAVRLYHHVAACSTPVAPSWDSIGRWRWWMGVPFDDTRDAPFSSARFLHQGIGVRTMGRYG